MFTLPFDPNKPIVGKASVLIDKSIQEVFEFLGEHFFDNYPKWAVGVVTFEPLDGNRACVGAKARQVKRDQGREVEAVFQISDFVPVTLLKLKGVTEDYQDYYRLETPEQEQQTRLTYTFELLHLELFMRPFEKLIRIAIEDGAETTVDNIKNLIFKASV